MKMRWGPTGLTPFMMVALLGNSEPVQLLVQAGADVNQPHLINGNPSGLSALKMAQNNGFDEIVQLLKAAGAKE